MGLNELRKPSYTITVNGSPMRLRCDLNAMDYLERSCGGLDKASTDIQSQRFCCAITRRTGRPWKRGTCPP